MVIGWGIIQQSYIFLRGGYQGEDGYLQTKDIFATPESWTSRTDVFCSVDCDSLLGNHARELHGPRISVELSDVGGAETSSRDNDRTAQMWGSASTVGCRCHSTVCPFSPLLPSLAQMSSKIATGSEGTAAAQREYRSLSRSGVRTQPWGPGDDGLENLR